MPVGAAPIAAAGLVLAAGSSRRLGEPKQLLPFRDGTLLSATLDAVRSFPLAQRVVTLGGYADRIRDRVDLTGLEVLEVVDHGSGCAASIAAALDVVRPDVDGIVLLLGDQPRVSHDAVVALLAAARAGAVLAVGRYRDGRGHPLWLGRGVFGDLRQLHGDKGVWRLLDRRDDEVVEVPLAGAVPIDVDTHHDHRRLLATENAHG